MAAARRLGAIADALAMVAPPTICGQAQNIVSASSGLEPYGGPKFLASDGRDDAYQGNPQSVPAARAADTFYQAVAADARRRHQTVPPEWTQIVPGQKLSYEHALAGPSDGLAEHRKLPVMVLAGCKPGPTLLLIAGEHGNECERLIAAGCTHRTEHCVAPTGGVAGC